MTVPTAITFVRLFLVPFLIYTIHQSMWPAALCIYVIGLVTDVLDGHLARKLNQQSVFGATLDPIVDKLMNVSCLYVLAIHSLTPYWFFVFVCVKEVFLLLGALYICFVRPCVPVGALFAGKLAGLFQGLYIVAVLLQSATGWLHTSVVNALLYASFLTCAYALIFYGLVGVRGLFTCKK